MEKGLKKIIEQDEIMNISGKNLIVSASAGSGKTTVMIRKILKYILDGDCHIDELLVLTYTKSAGLEMKKKLTDKLKELIEDRPELQKELDMVQTSDISTFDSFCQKLVKKYFYVLNIDPSFSVLEGSDQKHLQNQALEKAINKIRVDNPKVYENLLENFSPKRNEENIKLLILEIYNYLTSIYDEDEFLNNTKKLYDKDLKIAEKILKNYYDNILNSIKNSLENIKQKCINYNFGKYLIIVNQLIISIESLISAKDFGLFVDLANEITFPTLRAEKSDLIKFKDEIAVQKTTLTKLLDEVKKQYNNSENIAKSYKNCQKLVENLINLLILFKKEYNFLKTGINSYDFDDIEKMTINLLGTESVSAEIKSSYRYIFVDEFQDANKVQEKIIFLLNNDNLFFVGDTKQSIYAFRQSDPEIFLNIENNFKNDKNSCAKTLNCNFRTNKNILEFVNQIFNVIMTDGTCGLNYKKDAQFVPQAQYADLNDEVCVELDVVLQKENEEEKLTANQVYSVKNAVRDFSVNKYETESAFVCEKILSLIGQDIYDKEQDVVRKIGFKDITILLLKRGKFLDTLINNFNQVGIPYVVNVNQNLEECYDNQVLYNCMKVALNFNDDFALYNVLSSALFNFSDDELALIRLENSDEKNFYECFKNYQKNNEIGQKIAQFFQILDVFTYNLKYKGIYYALNDLLLKTKYLINISFDEDFDQRELNVNNYVNSFAGSKYDNNICDYILYRENAVRSEKVQTEKSFADAVEITTMHSSKGLEYPVVILPFLNQDYTKDPTHSEIKINKDIGIGIKNYDDEDRTIMSGIFYNACKIKNKEIELSEKIRLLYVAMTRAKCKLVMCGTLAKDVQKFTQDLQIVKTNNYLSLILGCLEQEIVDRINSRENFDCILYKNEKIKLSCIEYNVEDLTTNSLAMPKQSEESDVSQLADFLMCDLSAQKSNIALKNSVSYLVADDNASNNFAPQSLKINEHLVEKSNEKGTLYHSILEKIDFNSMNSIEDVQDFIDCNFLSEQIETIKEFGIANIFNNIKLLKTLTDRGDTIIKEQKFVMRVQYNKVANSDIEDNVLVQGIIDLLVIKRDYVILIDYKLSNKNDEDIKNKYAKQLELYALAVGKQFNKPIKKYILHLKECKLIDM